MKFQKKNCVIVIIGALYILASCENKLEKVKAFSPSEKLPIVEVKNISTIFTDSGEVRYSLKAPKSYLYETEGIRYYEFPEGINVSTYDNHNQIISRITANYAKQFIKEEKWEAKNNVVVVNSRNDTLKTELLIWDRKEKKIYTKEPVKIIQVNSILFGSNGCESDESMKKWIVYGTITGTIEAPVGNQTDSLSINHAATPNQAGNKP